MPSTPTPEDPRNSLRPVPLSEVREQEEAYRNLLAELGTADDDEVQAALEDSECQGLGCRQWVASAQQID